MPIFIRSADLSDVDVMADLLVQDAKLRCATNRTLWPLDRDARAKTISNLTAAMRTANPPFRQQWHLAEHSGAVIGLTHTILLPVPPIYAGEHGAPGLIMEDCFVAPDAPEGTRKALLDAAEEDLISAGAEILLASSVSDGAWEPEYLSRNYKPLTLYLATTKLTGDVASSTTRRASDTDIPGIVASSARHRQVLADLNERFWKPHPDADARFGAWMTKSLTLTDRDMFVSESGAESKGYAISQPATPLHFPTPHDIAQIGIIDDYYHDDFAVPDTLHDTGGAAALLHAAEAARVKRGNKAVLVVCPAAWASKITRLKTAGYQTAITWFIKS